jgi:hypothetical protein
VSRGQAQTQNRPQARAPTSAVRRANHEGRQFPCSHQRQGGCSQPQPISRTPDFSASSQYSLQYLLPSSGGHMQTPCLHFPVASWAIESNLLTLQASREFNFVGGCYEPMLGRSEREVKTAISLTVFISLVSLAVSSRVVQLTSKFT